ncbi:U4/U6.U5 tri-snRNP-associated protein 1 [Episyrphus balteatus]|uniref:U4/U6.U5 tri-snRNP-associated protein 1 n=1 Tax=Episyrphus balteatus TaxID=286459 RepID=UPI002485BE0F|nr:U4/U6.U5 tri-snRNP-associated protein 1 [Episyrphus balteatus]
MGSSSKKHRKESKKHKRSRSDSESSDVRVEKDRDTSRRRHRHHRSHKNDGEETRSRSGSLVPKSSSKSTEERRHKHKHKKHKERHHSKDSSRRKEDVIVSLDNSESDSSDCVEVPIEAEDGSTSKSQKKSSESARNDEKLLLEREQRARERDQRDREAELREREKREHEKEKEREREFREREREHHEREMAREREQARDRERDREREKYRDRERDRDQDRYHDQERYHQHQRESQQQKPSSSSRREPEKRKERSPSPIPENGAGDCLSIEETNKIRLKLGLKPLEVDSGPIKPSTAAAEKSSNEENNKSGAQLNSYKDEWGEFLHKPADNLKDKAQAEKLRDKLKQKKEKRMLEEKLKRIKTLGESDDEVDDVEKWVNRNKKKEDMRKEAEMRAKALEEMDAEFGVDELMEKDKQDSRRKAYNDKHLRGLRVDHDMEDFSEGKTVILTLKDKDVLDEEDDALVNVNMMDDEHYRKNVANKKKNPLSYGYDVYEEQYDMLGNPIDRGILGKYDEEIEGAQRKKNFVIGDNLEERKEQQRKLLEIKTKLAGKRLETLEDTRIQLASDTYTEVELAKFKKPKKKVKKIRQKLKADDLLPLGGEPAEKHFGRRGRIHAGSDDDVEMVPDESEMKHNIDEEDDLQKVLSKARKLKQKESLIKKTLPVDVTELKAEVKEEPEDEDEQTNGLKEGHITLNATAEFCRTLGDIPTYGMAGNRDEDSNDMMDYEVEERVNETKQEEPEASTGTWNSVNPEDVIRPMEDDISNDLGDVAILDEEPDVGAGVGNALKLALSKGYLEKDDKNRPSNSKLSYLQAKNYSIEDKSAGDDDKFGRRDRFHSGPIMEFRDKETFKPNVKLEYIDDNGRILNLKEAFRYLSHKFHGKGPGKNKIEKRLKKMEQDGLMKTMSSTDTPLGTLTMLQQKQKETKTPYVVLSGGKQAAAVSNTTISKYK